MKGLHHVIVQNDALKYEFDIRRNITVIRGDSASGKTVLIDMIAEYLVNGADSGVSLSCDVQLGVLTGNLWQQQLAALTDAIVFIDEGNRFVVSKEFAEAVKRGDNYFVIVTRENPEMLPISVDEIYGIRSSGKYGALTPVYHRFYRIYDFGRREALPIRPDVLLTEASNSGYEFFRAVAEEGHSDVNPQAGNPTSFAC